jgi:3-methyladenine DNA glycosylase AlkD
MTVAEAVADIRTRLEAAADPDHAAGVRNFFKEPVDPWGVRTADLQPIVRQAYGVVKHWPKTQRNALCEELWRGRLEEGVLVNHLYRKFGRECARCEFKLFARWIDRHVTNWAHCDGVASWLLAACIENDPALKAELPRWTRARNHWKRRASMVALLQEAKKGRISGEILDMAMRLKDDENEMVQKGVGWVLKEMYPKRPEEVVEFLTEVEFPRLVVRLAAEKMSADHRRRFGFQAK